MASHPKFLIKQAKNGQFYFNLTAKNGQVIASSEMHATKAACENGCQSVRENAPIAEIEEVDCIVNLSKANKHNSNASFFCVGDRVRKVKGYAFPGVVVARFKNLKGMTRYVVECDEPAVSGILHIYSQKDLKRD